MRIVVSTPTWSVSGVNSFTSNLLKGLSGHHDVQLLIINQHNAGADVSLPTEFDVSWLEWDRSASWWQGRWEALQAHLHARPDTIYLPNYDFENSAVVPTLRNDVGVLGIIHSDDPEHYEHLERCGRYWNACVTVSKFIHDQVAQEAPSIADRCFQVSYGVPAYQPKADQSAAEDRPLRILYTGRFDEPQKRISDVARIALKLHDRGVPFELCFIGSGACEDELRATLKPLSEKGIVRFAGLMTADQVLEHYPDHDCLVLTSNFEGLPLSLLEAMSCGCVPVVSETRSGIPDVVRHGVNGMIAPIGEVSGFADNFCALHHDRTLLARMKKNARKTIADGPFSIDRVVDRYNEIFDFIAHNIASGAYVRPSPYRPRGWTGDFFPPASLQISPDKYFQLKWQAERLATEASGATGTTVEPVSAKPPSIWRKVRRRFLAS